jgi:hypothetical protein
MKWFERCVVDEAMKPLVELGEVGKSAVRLAKQIEMFRLDSLERSPSRVVGRKRDELLRRAQFQHFPHLEEFLGEFAGESFERPASARAFLQKSELAEAIEIVADCRSRDAELTREVEPVDLLAGLAIAVQDPLHEPLFDDRADLLGLEVGVEVGRRWAPQ